MSISRHIWALKYRSSKPDGSVETSIEETWQRVAQALAAAEPATSRGARTREFFDAMQDYKLLPAGRILTTAGCDDDRTMINTFVMADFEDTVDGVMKVAHEAAVTMRMGGGIGFDFSKLRPRGSALNGGSGTAAGPLAAMHVCDSMCAMMSSSARRGAMMATMRCDHPDIRDFITAKSDKHHLRNFNLSVMVTDPFMRAVDTDDDWALVWNGETHDTLPARALWNLIMRQNYDAAEPGILFIDRMNAANPLNYLETISATNSCAEQPLPPEGSAPLASINLARLVRNPFEPTACLDRDQLQALAATGVRLLDGVIDVTRYPTEGQAREARAKRRIGLGVTGVANALAMIGETYGSPSAATLLGTWMKDLHHAAVGASVELARERGHFDGFDAERYCASPIVGSLEPALRDRVERHGVRNALVTSIAPTGTISLLAGNVSSGIEPTFAQSYDRIITLPGGEKRTERMEDYSVGLFRKKFGRTSKLPSCFVTAMTLNPEDHVIMQAAAQQWVDSSISKTVNVPQNIDFASFKTVYRDAYAAGCKGCTTYRPNAVTGSVISALPIEKKSRKKRLYRSIVDQISA